MDLIKFHSSSTVEPAAPTHPTPRPKAMMIARRANRSVRPTPTSQKTRFLDEESTVASDTSSSLGAKLQIPQAFLVQNKSSQQQQPSSAAIFSAVANNGHPSSSSRLREEAKIQRLLIAVKHQRETTALCSPQDIRKAQAMSVKLPAYHRHQQHHQAAAAAKPRPMFRGSNAWTSAAAVGTFAEVSQDTPGSCYVRNSTNSNRSTSPPPSSRRRQSPRERTTGKSCEQQVEDKKRSCWRSWLPRFSSTPRSSLVHV